MKQSRAKGLVAAMVSSCSYGLIPLFSLPVMQAGMLTQSVLIYRFGLGTLFILSGMLAMKVSPRITWSQFWRIGVLALFSMLGAVTLLYGYYYMPSGPATTIQFSYPVFTCVMMVLFFHERLTLKVVVAIVLAVLDDAFRCEPHRFPQCEYYGSGIGTDSWTHLRHLFGARAGV